MAPFAPGTRSKRDEKDGGLLSPRCTSLHRRTEGHGVYFCRVAAAVTGQKACGFHPASPPRASAFLSLSLFLSPSHYRFVSLFPLHHRFSPAFPSASRSPAFVALTRPDPPPSSLPFRHTAVLLALFSLLATPLFMPPHGPRSVPASRPASLFVRSPLPPVSFSPFLGRSSAVLSCSRTRLPPSLFRRYPLLSTLPLSSPTCKPIAHASERARRKIGTAWRTKSTRKRREREREVISEYRIHARASENAPRERRCERKGRNEPGGRDVPAKSDGICRGRKEEKEGEKNDGC